MSDLVKFSIPADFISSRVSLTPGELACGYQKGWLTANSLADLAAGLSRGLSGSQALRSLAVLPLDDVGDQVDSLLEDEQVDCDSPDMKDVWLYLALAWLYEHRDTIRGLFDVIEMIYADADYPEELEGFVAYMPPPPGQEFGESAMLRRLESYLRERENKYRSRDATQSH